MVELNPEQQAAVIAEDGAALVLAGAGSGKTRVIVERMVWLINERGVDPRYLLALTFTNKAARQMQQRVAGALDVDRIASWVGTFHSFGLFILRREHESLELNRNFVVFDDGDQMALMKRLIKELPSSFDRVSPRDALQFISLLKQDLKKPDPDEEPQSNDEVVFRELWDRYHNALRQASAVDFDDLLVLPARLLDENESVRAKYQRRYRYVLIDEYQDTNRAQYWIAKRLSESHGNLFAVGDEDQGIYSWRGADIKNILDFSNDFPNAHVYRLERNYRSTKPILDAANAVVANNEKRLGKTLWTEVTKGAPVRFYQAEDATDEARYVARAIAQGDFSPREVAVLYRTNGQARLLEEALARQGLAYVVVGGVKFYARKECKDILAYLRLVANPQDDEALRRIINVPRRGIGATTLEKFEERARLHRTGLLQAVRDAESDQTLSAGIRTKAADFAHLIDDLALKAREERVEPLVEDMLAKSGYRNYVQETNEKEFRDRLEIVDEFLAACAEFDLRNGSGLTAFLQELALQTDIDNYDDSLPAVTLMTCHNAKGLEYDCIFLTGLEEGLLPHSMALYDDNELEEERRLCYVAMTRARKELYLTAAQERTLYGRTECQRISRFVEEIPNAMLEIVEAGPGRRPTVAKPAAPTADAEEMKMGTRVRHAKFGRGVVSYVKGSGAKRRARIRFETGRSREFILSKAPLEVLEDKRR